MGVPVEFRSREAIRENPVTGMTGYGTYNLPPGTWSDDSALTFCLAEALMNEPILHGIAKNFQKWLYQNYWTANGNVFDVGITTRQAIYNLSLGTTPELAGGFGEDENGNGSLMRILPLVFYVKDKPVDERFTITKAVSAITHRHIRSIIACFYYLEFAKHLLNKDDKFSIYQNLKTSVADYLHSVSIDPSEIQLFHRLLVDNIYDLTEDQIHSSGYVVHTLEASIWCILTANSYEAAVLKAVNLGADTDTTAAVTGGLAGLLFGFNNIPAAWITQLARQTDIDDLASRLTLALEYRQVPGKG